MTSEVENDIVTILNSWEEQLDTNSLLFENPVTNFLALDMIKHDIIQGYGPSALLKKCKKIVTNPSKDDIKKSALLVQEMVEEHNLSWSEGVAT